MQHHRARWLLVTVLLVLVASGCRGGSEPPDLSVGPETEEAGLEAEPSPEGGPATETIWVVNHADGTLLHLDPADNAILTTIDVGRALGLPAVGEGSVWVPVASQV